MIKDSVPSEALTFNSIARFNLLLLKLGALVAFDGRRLSYVPTTQLSLLIHCSYILITSMYIWNVAMQLISDSRQYDIEVIAECVGLCGVHARFICLYARRHIIAKIFTECRNLCDGLDKEEKAIVRYFVDKCTRITLFYLVANGIMCVFYLGVSQIPVSTSSGLNKTFTRSLPYVFFADIQKTPWYEITVTAQMVSMICLGISSAGVETLAPLLIMFACGHLRTLYERLHNLGYIEAEALLMNGEEEIIRNIIYHQKIIGFCKEIEKLSNLLFVMQLLSTTYNMSVIGLKLVGDDPEKFKYVSVLAILIIQLFMCQWAPDVLVTESESLAIGAYFIPSSNREDKKMAKLIQILMIRSQRCIQLTAGGFVRLSMETFGSMITSAMSFFTILRSVH